MEINQMNRKEVMAFMDAIIEKMKHPMSASEARELRRVALEASDRMLELHNNTKTEEPPKPLTLGKSLLIWRCDEEKNHGDL